MSLLTVRLGREVVAGKPATYAGVKHINIGRKGDTSHYGGFLPIAVLKQGKRDGKTWRVYLPDDIGPMGATIHGTRLGSGLRMEYAKAVAALVARHSDATQDSPTGSYHMICAAIGADPDGVALKAEIAVLIAIQAEA